ncbi:MAG TPA: alpha/beta hydrolase [Acidimicrobiales bacterium]|nr:alpha/beta hydrolase [Acidimicrobiales bacterium]
MNTDRLVWTSTEVCGRRVKYGVAGEGVPVLFVHGWALGNRAYKRALSRLARLGCRVYAPALPGFGGSATLPARHCGLDAYAAWANAFLAAVSEEGPVVAVGHSFGAAVAAKLAHDFPGRASQLVLINPLGGSVWKSSGDKTRTMAERPLWDWAVSFPKDLLLDRRALLTLAAVVEDAGPNLATNPMGVWRAAELARRIDLAAELDALRRSGMPVRAVWAEGDVIIPKACFESLCEALGRPGTVVRGRHSWLLADPESFAEVMAETVAAAASVPPAAAAARAAG